MNKKILKITETAVMLALLIALQAVTKPLGQIVTGSCVNAVLAITVMLVGMGGGISVALIASSSPIGCIFAGLFYGVMKYGGSKLSFVNAPSEIVDIIMGTIILFIAVSHVFKYILTKNLKKREVK